MILAGTISSIAPKIVVCGVFDDFSIASREQQFLQFRMLLELLLDGGVHDAEPNFGPVVSDRCFARTAESRCLHRRTRFADFVLVRSVREFLRLEIMLGFKTNE